MIAVGEYRRREGYLKTCTDAEVEAFQKPIQSCLEFDPDDRITSSSLVQHLQMMQEVVGVPTMGNAFQDAPQCMDNDTYKLLVAEIRHKDERCLMQENEVALESKIQELQHKLDGVCTPSKWNECMIHYSTCMCVVWWWWSVVLQGAAVECGGEGWWWWSVVVQSVVWSRVQWPRVAAVECICGGNPVVVMVQAFRVQLVHVVVFLLYTRSIGVRSLAERSGQSGVCTCIKCSPEE